MIKNKFFTLLLLIYSVGLVAQSNKNKWVDLITLTNDYLVPENSVDTAFAKLLIINSTDSLVFSNLQLVLHEKNNMSWIQTQSIQITYQQLNDTLCNTPFCVFRENENKIGVYLGYYPLSKTYKANLQLFIPNQLSLLWSKEF